MNASQACVQTIKFNLIAYDSGAKNQNIRLNLIHAQKISRGMNVCSKLPPFAATIKTTK